MYAPRMAWANTCPAAASTAGKPTRCGSPSASPVTHMMPLSACAAMSSPGRYFDGPCKPNPLTVA